jgi:hypothetical protein
VEVTAAPVTKLTGISSHWLHAPTAPFPEGLSPWRPGRWSVEETKAPLVCLENSQQTQSCPHHHPSCSSDSST